jgi:hypothetical protein
MVPAWQAAVDYWAAYQLRALWDADVMVVVEPDVWFPSIRCFIHRNDLMLLTASHEDEFARELPIVIAVCAR